MEFKILFFLLIGICVAKDCNKADVVFLLDESSSIQPTPFAQIKQFVFDVIDGINVGPNDTQSLAAVMMFSNEAHFLFRFNILKTLDLERAKELLTDHLQRGGSTHTYKGLDLIRRVAFSPAYGARVDAGVAKICIVITDGNSQLPDRTKEMAGRLHIEGKAHVFAIGVGNETQIRQEELENIASDKQSVFRVEDASGLNKIKGSISGAACNVQPREVPTTPAPTVDEDYQWVPTEGSPTDYVAGEEKTISES